MCGSADFQVGWKETDDTAAAFKEAANWTEIDTLMVGFCGVGYEKSSIEKSKHAVECRRLIRAAPFLQSEFREEVRP